MYFRFARALCVLFVLGLSPLPSLAESLRVPTQTEVLTLSHALAKALESSPELAAFPATRRIVEAEKLQASLYPNPSVGLELENFAGSGNLRGGQALQSTLTLSQVIPLGQKLERNVEVATARLGDVVADYDIARLDVLAETARRYTDVAEAQARDVLARRSVELAENTLQAVQRRVRAGATSSAETSRAQVALIQAQIDLQRAAAQLDAARIALAAMWGATEPSFEEIGADLASLPPLKAFGEFVAAMEAGPRLHRYATTLRLREAELRLAKAQAVPDLTVSAGVRRLEHGATGANPDHGLVASLSLPLPFFDRNQGNIAAAHARIQQNEIERDATSLRLRTVLYGLYRADQQARTRAQTLSREAIPQADKALDLIERGYARGAISFLDLLDAQRQSIALQADVISARADAHRLDTELERLSAQPVVAPLPTTSAITVDKGTP
ncbi:MAG: TolC family protein [Nevskiaceae bacterium]|nr:MAG: TolC family protein [Nevskiaceae bacterium]TBR71839.1 MAG: TolC family protein [Nevskiaceae bacterium]